MDKLNFIIDVATVTLVVLIVICVFIVYVIQVINQTLRLIENEFKSNLKYIISLNPLLPYLFVIKKMYELYWKNKNNNDNTEE